MKPVFVIILSSFVSFSTFAREPKAAICRTEAVLAAQQLLLVEGKISSNEPVTTLLEMNHDAVVDETWKVEMKLNKGKGEGETSYFYKIKLINEMQEGENSRCHITSVTVQRAG